MRTVAVLDDADKGAAAQPSPFRAARAEAVYTQIVRLIQQEKERGFHESRGLWFGALLYELVRRQEEPRAWTRAEVLEAVDDLVAAGRVGVRAVYGFVALTLVERSATS
jgi:hypothetical protein